MNQPNTQSLNTEVIVANATQGEQHIYTTFKTQYILKDVEVLSRKKVIVANATQGEQHI